MTRALDNMIDRAPGGEIEMTGGGFRQRYKGNWKLHAMENANDLMHASDRARIVGRCRAGSRRRHGRWRRRSCAADVQGQNGLPLAMMDEVGKYTDFQAVIPTWAGFYKEGPITQQPTKTRWSRSTENR